MLFVARKCSRRKLVTRGTYISGRTPGVSRYGADLEYFNASSFRGSEGCARRLSVCGRLHSRAAQSFLFDATVVSRVALPFLGTGGTTGRNEAGPFGRQRGSLVLSLLGDDFRFGIENDDVGL